MQRGMGVGWYCSPTGRTVAGLVRDPCASPVDPCLHPYRALPRRHASIRSFYRRATNPRLKADEHPGTALRRTRSPLLACLLHPVHRSAAAPCGPLRQDVRPRLQAASNTVQAKHHSCMHISLCSCRCRKSAAQSRGAAAASRQRRAERRCRPATVDQCTAPFASLPAPPLPNPVGSLHRHGSS